MQSFLTNSDLTTNASILDSKRLFKMVLENKQVLDVIINNKKAWSNHPVTRMWRDYPIALHKYIESCWIECQKRNIAVHSKLFAESNDLIAKLKNQELIWPKWIHRTDIHSSHRSRLLCKGFIDALCVDLKRDLKIKKMNDWLKLHYKKEKNQLKYDDALKIMRDYPLVSPATPNYYDQFRWNDDIRAEYIWPF